MKIQTNIFCHEIFLEYEFFPIPIEVQDFDQRYDAAIKTDDFNIKITITNQSERPFPKSCVQSLSISSTTSSNRIRRGLTEDVGGFKPLQPSESDSIVYRLARPITGVVDLIIHFRSEPDTYFQCLYKESGELISCPEVGGQRYAENPDGHVEIKTPVHIISDLEIQKIKDEEMEKIRAINIRNIQVGVSVLILIFAALNCWHAFHG